VGQSLDTPTRMPAADTLLGSVMRVKTGPPLSPGRAAVPGTNSVSAMTCEKPNPTKVETLILLTFNPHVAPEKAPEWQRVWKTPQSRPRHRKFVLTRSGIASATSPTRCTRSVESRPSVIACGLRRPFGPRELEAGLDVSLRGNSRRFLIPRKAGAEASRRPIPWRPTSGVAMTIQQGSSPSPEH
jgi:hypothetical protein